MSAQRSPDPKTNQTVLFDNENRIPIFSCSVREIEAERIVMNKLAQNWSQFSAQTFGLNETAIRTGMKTHDIINIIRREQIIDPENDERGYRFRERDIEILTLIARLKQFGFRLATIRQIIAEPDHGAYASERLAEALCLWLTSRTQQHYDTVIEALSKVPLLDEQESIVYRLSQKGVALSECAAEAHLESEPEARRVLESACAKIGRYFPVMLHLR